MKLTRRGFFGAASASVAVAAVLPSAPAAAEHEDETAQGNEAASSRDLVDDTDNLDTVNAIIRELRKHGLIA